METKEKLQELQKSFINRKHINEMVYLTIAEAIAQGVLSGGTILRESAIAETLGISRTPVRAALYRLEEEGLVVCDEKKGFTVRQFTNRFCIDVVEAFDLIVAETTRCMAGKMPNAYLLLLADNNEKLLACSDDIERCELNNTFHLLIVESTRNEILIDFARSLFTKLRIINCGILPIHFTDESVERHKRILAALKSGDAQEIEEALAEHERFSNEYTKQILCMRDE